MSKFYKINNNIRVKIGCDPGKACEHLVLIEDKSCWMFGLQIYDMCINENIRPPEHFRHFADHLKIKSKKDDCQLM